MADITYIKKGEPFREKIVVYLTVLLTPGMLLALALLLNGFWALQSNFVQALFNFAGLLIIVLAGIHKYALDEFDSTWHARSIYHPGALVAASILFVVISFLSYAEKIICRTKN